MSSKLKVISLEPLLHALLIYFDKLVMSIFIFSCVCVLNNQLSNP